ncbi:hypothetical protein [Neorhizobium sp. DAR64860/K0K1]|uniref:hypothetical protein n=1 Tax=Neorhizobium sp. DAR64860/K0K1 TaxID=3421955 RepID=UPI003D2E2CF5
MRMITSADQRPDLAIAIGRFSQASASLERAIQSAIIRLLPLTDDMGLAILCENTMRANLEILTRLLKLPEVPVPESWKASLLDLIPQVKASSEDRNRLMHNVILEGETGLIATIEKKGNRSYMPISVETIICWVEEAGDLAALFGSVPHCEYDLSKWEKSWPAYEPKDWPKRPGK